MSAPDPAELLPQALRSLSGEHVAALICATHTLLCRDVPEVLPQSVPDSPDELSFVLAGNLEMGITIAPEMGSDDTGGSPVDPAFAQRVAVAAQSFSEPKAVDELRVRLVSLTHGVRQDVGADRDRLIMELLRWSLFALSSGPGPSSGPPIQISGVDEAINAALAEPARGPDPGVASETSAATSTEGPGSDVIATCFEWLSVDSYWSQVTTDGFRWWPHRLVQQIWQEGPRASLGETIQIVHTETAVWRGVPDCREVYQVTTDVNRRTALEALVYDPESKTLNYRSTVVVTESTPYYGSFMALAAARQLTEAEGLMEAMAGLSGEPDMTSHPQHGRRETADDMVAIGSDWLAAAQDEPANTFRPAHLLQAQGLLPDGCEPSTCDGAVLQYFPDLSQSILERVARLARRSAPPVTITARLDDPHPSLGPGLAVTATMAKSRHGNTHQRANRLNLAVSRTPEAPALLGAWHGGGGLHFTTFVPNLIGQSQNDQGRVMLVANTIILAAAQVHWTQSQEFAYEPNRTERSGNWLRRRAHAPKY